MVVINITRTMVIDKRTRSWCRLPYPGHPDGCPNYGDPGHIHCPPTVGHVGDFIDIARPHWFVVLSFNLAAHAAGLKKKHPNWSDRQCRCCLYWQGTVRKQLGIDTIAFMIDKPGTVSTMIPEAMGVNVFRTCHRHGIMLRKNPQNIVYKVALVGYGKGNNNAKC